MVHFQILLLYVFRWEFDLFIDVFLLVFHERVHYSVPEVLAVNFFW